MIDDGLLHPWPPEVVEALTRWKQGHLVRKPPLLFAADPNRRLWTQDGLEDRGDGLYALPEDRRPAYGLITSQTCDINEGSRTPKKPWVQVAPVFNAAGRLDVSQLRLVEKWRVGYLVPLSRGIGDGSWVADLRIEFPMEKGALVGRIPISGFDDEAGYLRLAQYLAGQRERPALADALIKSVVVTLRKFLERGRNSELRDRVTELRLAIGGDRIAPHSARLLVLTESTPTTEEDVEQWEEWWDDARERAAAESINLAGNRYVRLQDMSAAEYLETVSLDFSYLSPGEDDC